MTTGAYLGGGPGKVWMPPPGGSIDLSQMNAATQSAVLAGGMRNRIINGGCRIAQRAARAYPSGVGGYGGPDRFVAANGGAAGGQFTQLGGVLGDSTVQWPCVGQTVQTPPTSLTGANYWSGIQQVLECIHSFDLLGKQLTLSFLFYSQFGGTFAVALRDSTGTAACVQTFTAVAATTTPVVITFPAVPLSLALTYSSNPGLRVAIGGLNTGNYAAPSKGAWLAGNYFTTTDSVNWAAAGGQILATNIQLEPGTVATPFEFRPHTLELILCQRYYQSFIVGATNGAVTAAGQNIGVSITYPVPMRTTPVFTLVQDIISLATPTGAPNPSQQNNVGSIFYKVSNAGSTNANWYAIMAADAEF
jgi:hypothetical protein